MKASDIAAAVGGTLEGGANPDLVGVAPLDRAGPADLSFVAHPRYAAAAAATNAGAVLVAASLSARPTGIAPRIIVEDVHRALAVLLPVLYPERRPAAGIHPTALIGDGVRLGAEVSIGPYAVIGDGARIGDRVRVGPHCVIGEDSDLGDDVVLHSHVTIYPHARIGDRSILHSGVRIGVDGFGYAFVDGAHRKVPQVGRCVIGTDVEIGANSTVDRGSVGATEIGDGVKIDNLVHIGHNVRVGAHSIIVAQVGIAGSSTIGRHVTLAGQAGISGHLSIGDGATVAAQGGVFGNLKGGVVYSGYPARPHKEALRAQASVARLPRLVRRIRELERAVFGREAESE